MVCNERETAVLKGEPMGLFGKMFCGGDKPVAVDLTKPYRDLLAQQTAPVVRGVILHAIASMDELQHPDTGERALLGDEVIDEMKRRLRWILKAYDPSSITELSS